MSSYDPQAIEARWQAHWAEQRTFRTPNPGEPGFDPERKPFYVLDMFPFPSGYGLHVGHPLGYFATDIVARYKRMTGANVLHPMGYDAFGLPTEQFAVETGQHPADATRRNVDNITRQIQRLGLSYDWDRKLATTEPDYVRWTQWIFLQFFHSYLDPVERRARPISELVRKLEAERFLIDPGGELIVAGVEESTEALGGLPVGERRWREMADDERADFLDGQRLAYLAEVPVNWCPALGTVLANEEVTAEGRSERGNHPVTRRPLKQWMLRITAYADRLLEDLEQVDWPESIKQMQRNWIGRSEGASVDFALADIRDVINVYTTRPDTLFGATYMVLAPEHPLVDELATDAQREAVLAYRSAAIHRSDVDRTAEAKQKTGVFTGSYAINPTTGQRIPVWVADYVLWGYGSGAIMAVPAHDDRDFEFARQFELPVQPVVRPSDAWLAEHWGGGGEPAGAEALRLAYEQDPTQFTAAFTGVGEAMASANDEVSLDGLPTPEAKRRIIDWLAGKGLGRGRVQYKLRDWLFSRQRYWGEPFPILHGPNGEVRAVDEAELPVELPPIDDFSPVVSDDPDAPPRPPLAKAPESWLKVTIDGQVWTRELNTMPNWAGSCWYYLRYITPRDDDHLVDPEAERYWMHRGEVQTPDGQAVPAGGVDLYVGGAEHAVLHLLYARFWHKLLYDLGVVSTPEPFGRYFAQGYIQAYYYEDPRGVRVPADEVVDQDGRPAMEVQDEPDRRFFHRGEPVKRLYGKMGKSLKNALAPDEIADQYGADTLRLYEMYLGPLEQSKTWSTRDIVGVHRFLQRVWRNFFTDAGQLRVTDDAAPHELRQRTHRTIARVTDDMERMSFNTAIAALIELNNDLVKHETLPREVAEPLVLMLAPLAPHLAEELWSRIGHDESLAWHPWPSYDEAMLVDKMIELPVQVKGKVRSRITVAADAAPEAVEREALADPKIAELLGETPPRKVIVIPGKLVNIVPG